MHALRTGLNADKSATFVMFPKRFYHSLVLQMTFIPLEVAECRYTCAILKHMKMYESG